MLLRKRLERAGHEVIAAVDGQQALELHAAKAPAILVLDAMMPRLSGVEVLKRLRDDGDDVPVVIVSAHRDTAELQEAVRSGAGAVLRKPFDWDELLAAIDRLTA